MMRTTGSLVTLTVLLTLVGVSPVMAASNADLTDDVVSITVSNIAGDSANCSVTFTGDNVNDSYIDYQLMGVGTLQGDPVAGSFSETATVAKADAADKDWSAISLYYYPPGAFVPWPVQNVTYSNTCDSTSDDVVSVSITNSRKNPLGCKILFTGKNLIPGANYRLWVDGTLLQITISRSSFRKTDEAIKSSFAAKPWSAISFTYINGGSSAPWPVNSLTYKNTCTP